MRNNFIVYYLLLLICQMMVCNFLHVSPLLTLNILPALILCVPTRIKTVPLLLIAFVSGLAVDLFSDCSIGLNAFALLPVALVKLSLCSFIFGEELIVREEEFSIRKYGLAKVLFVIIILQTIFLLLYIGADGGSVRTLEFSAIRFGLSLLSGVVVSIPLVSMLKPDERK